MRAPRATAKEDDLFWINSPNDSLNDLLNKLWCKLGQVSRNPLREQARGLVRIAQAVEQLIAPIANVFADLDVVPAIPLVLFANTIGSRHPAILCRPDFFCFVALLAGHFQNKIDRFPGVRACANNKVWVVNLLGAFLVGVKNAKIQEGILDPRNDAAFIRQIIQHFRHLAFPAAVDDNNVHMAVFCRMHFLTRLAMHEPAASRRIVVVQLWPNALPALSCRTNRFLDMGRHFLWIMEIEELFPFWALMQDADLVVVPIRDNGRELVETIKLWISLLIGELFP